MTDPAGEPSDKDTSAQTFEDEADSAQPSVVREFIDLLMDNCKWWLAPIIVVLLLLAVLIMLAGTGAAPFIYTLF
jgi:hypothetical protein